MKIPDKSDYTWNFFKSWYCKNYGNRSPNDQEHSVLQTLSQSSIL